ncbi:rod shape-determining protein MreD [Flavobacterium sp. NRK F7]|uniref:rod shape-determining protein MreD n=1 Tax=Flavobacterium sp. NRK F7 TaxID=2954930 RepID=UPI0020903431|nr:rod shape-determining protein MreD [Flavobacterium sp. NRK F7]MCO6161370.1 rod shape-determining protein MreD [Flavobacterium sp. NRK F7]
MNNNILNIVRFILLVFLQVILFNNINMFGFANPYPYVLFILLFPVNGNKSVLLISSFFIGLIIDMFSNSHGIHAMACTALAFVRPNLFRFSFGISYEYQTVKIADKITSERVSYVLLALFIHHFVLFFFEYFSLTLFFEIIYSTLISTILSFIICLLIIYLIKPNKR